MPASTRSSLRSLVLLLAVGSAALALVPTSASGATPPDVPPPTPGVDREIVSAEAGAVLTFTMPERPTPGLGGVDVGLGGISRCGSLGCVAYGMAWTIPDDMVVVRDCTNLSWTCTVRYEPWLSDSSSFSRVEAVFGEANPIAVMEFLVWSPPRVALVQVGILDQWTNEPTLPWSVHLVRAGTSPTFSDCRSGPEWMATQRAEPSPAAPDCVVMELRSGSTNRAWAYLPLGSGPWIGLTNLIGTTGPVASSERRTAVGVGGRGQWADVEVPPVPDAGFVVDAPFVVQQTTTTSTLPTPTSTSPTTSIPLGSAPPPPVVTNAEAGTPGSVRGTVDGRPGDDVTVTIAHSPGPSCARQMTGSGITTVGSTVVTIDADGESPFEIAGTVPSSGFVYGVAGSSSVGDCFGVADAPTTTVAPTSGRTVLSADAAVGSDRVSVASQTDVAIGSTVRIGTGSTSEVRAITGYGSLVLSAPLARSHPAGTPVEVIPVPADDTAPPTISVATELTVPVPVGSSLVLRFSCIDSGVGVERCGDPSDTVGGVVDGMLLDTSEPGRRSLAIRAWDRNGNVATSLVEWVVVQATPAGDPAATLPATGTAPNRPSLAIGVALLLVGGALAAAARRRRVDSV